jgi:hypothetical protein
LDDADGWTEYFEGVLNAGAGERAALTEAQLEVKDGIAPTLFSDMGVLNECIEESEVEAAVASLSANKAGDALGITAECLKNACVRGEEGTRYLLVPVLTKLFNAVLDDPAQFPKQFRLNTLTPIYKGKGEATDMNNYRGIAVGSILGKVYERVLYARANEAAEQHALRAPTQCGFRKGHGTLDGMFVLRHLVDKARRDGKRLFCLFVDFEKAFDSVPRPELLRRCRALGMHGKFLRAIEALYAEILMAMKLQGRVGPAFASTQGTKQGGELSPLLFGMFIEQLHDLILDQCPGVGPMVGGMRVPDIMYADDVACLAYEPEHIQQLLDCLQLFCDLFGMKVNVGKTLVVVFRKSKGLPQRVKDFVWLYAGQPVRVEQEFKYLGATLHCTKGGVAAATALAAAGRRAMHKLVTRLRQARVSQPAFQLRMFRVLVEPVLSYGCQVFAPDLFGALDPAKILDNAQESVQLDFLRHMLGLPKSVSRWVLLREFDVLPLHVRWLKLCARFWRRVLALPAERLLRKALVDDIELFVRGGCCDCWSAKFLRALQAMGMDLPLFSVVALTRTQTIDEEGVATLAAAHLAAMWADLPAPDTAPSDKVTLATYARWVRGDAATGPAPYLTSFLPRALTTCLARLRAGTNDLRIHTGRFSGLLRSQRTCLSCRQPHAVDDLIHFTLQCPTHAATRAAHPDLFRHATSPSQVFAHPDQFRLAKVLSAMLAERQSGPPPAVAPQPQRRLRVPRGAPSAPPARAGRPTSEPPVPLPSTCTRYRHPSSPAAAPAAESAAPPRPLPLPVAGAPPRPRPPPAAHAALGRLVPAAAAPRLPPHMRPQPATVRLVPPRARPPPAAASSFL